MSPFLPNCILKDLVYGIIHIVLFCPLGDIDLLQYKEYYNYVTKYMLKLNYLKNSSRFDNI